MLHFTNNIFWLHYEKETRKKYQIKKNISVAKDDIGFSCPKKKEDIVFWFYLFTFFFSKFTIFYNK